MERSTRPLQPGADGPEAEQAAPLSPISPQATLLAASAFDCGVSPEAISSLFADCGRAGFGLDPAFEAAILDRLAALRGAQ